MLYIVRAGRHITYDVREITLYVVYDVAIRIIEHGANTARKYNNNNNNILTSKMINQTHLCMSRRHADFRLTVITYIRTRVAERLL